MKKFILCLVMLFMMCSCGKSDSGILDDGKYTTDSGIYVYVDSFSYEDGYSIVNLILKNNNDYDVYIGDYIVNVYDKDDKLIGVFNPNFDDVLKSGESTNQMFSTEADYSKAYRFEYKFEDVKENTEEK